MGALFKKPPTPPKPPMIDDAVQDRNNQDAKNKGKAAYSTVLTSPTGLPSLGLGSRMSPLGKL